MTTEHSQVVTMAIMCPIQQPATGVFFHILLIHDHLWVTDYLARLGHHMALFGALLLSIEPGKAQTLKRERVTTTILTQKPWEKQVAPNTLQLNAKCRIQPRWAGGWDQNWPTLLPPWYKNSFCPSTWVWDLIPPWESHAAKNAIVTRAVK